MAKLSAIAQAVKESKKTATTVCVFGPPKAGKTELVGNLAKEGFKILYIGMENGHETLLKLPQEAQENIETVLIPDTKVFPIAIQTCLKIITGGKFKICDKHGAVSCALCAKDQAPFTEVCLKELDSSWIVAFDSGTQLSSSAMAHITKDQDDDYKYDWEDYRKQGTLLDKFLSQVQQSPVNLGCSICIITHEIEVEMEDGKKKLVPLFGTTNFSRNSAKYFAHVVYVEVKNKKHAAASATTYASNILTGSRTDVAVEKKEVPSLAAIFRGEVGAKSENVGTNVQGQAAMNALAKLKAQQNK